MMRDIRMADGVDVTGQRLSIAPTANPDGITDIQYELLNGTLYYRRTIGGTQTTVEMIRSDESVKIDSFAFTRQTGVEDDGTTIYTKVLTATLGMRSGDNRFDVTASVCPRRSIQW
jgi:hypothetical protein